MFSILRLLVHYSESDKSYNQWSQKRGEKTPKPTQKDAELLLRVLELTQNEEGRRANRWFWKEFDIKSYGKFKRNTHFGARDTYASTA